jgi:FAD/FMN-containing dehydrogenase
MTRPAPSKFRGEFRDDEAARAVYAEAAGIGRIVPLGVAVPRDAEDAADLVRWARGEGITIVPRGSGSSMAGGAVGPGIVVDLSRLRSGPVVDAAERTVRIGAGITRGEIDRAAGAVGLRFPVDPSSGEFATIGGMVSTNASGARSLRHGSTRPWVRGLECVFDDGSVARIERGAPLPPDIAALRRFQTDAHSGVLGYAASSPGVRRAVLKESSGYAVGAYAESLDVLDLLVGSEGTLALFTSVDLALIPTAGGSAVLLLSFDNLDAAVNAAVACRSLDASACELLDQTFLSIAAESGAPLPAAEGADAVLVVETEGDDQAAAADAAHELLALLRREHAPIGVIVAVDPDREHELWAVRHAASPAIARMDPSLRSMQFIEDAAVPPERLADYVRGVRAILAREQTRVAIFGHAGDAHVHVNPLIDVRDHDWRPRLERILLDVTALVASLGGTLSGEHGDGRLRTPLLDRVWSADALACFAAIKRAFDPVGVFNPGVKVPLPGQQAVDIVKYDPALRSPPDSARRVLAVVEHERAYARFRLALLDDMSKFPAHGTLL